MNEPEHRDGLEVPDYDDVWQNVYGDLQHFGPVHRHLARIIQRELATLTYESVLEVGCGPGHNYDLVTKQGAVPRYAGVDVSEWAIEQANRRRPADYTVCDIQTGAPEGTWDLVYCSLVLEHVPDDAASLHNMRKVTGKYLMLVSIAGDFERYRPWEELMGHVRNYRRGELEEKVHTAGFRVLRSVYWGFPFFSPMARTLQSLGKTGTGRYTAATRIVAEFMYWLYFLNSHRRGDIVIVLAEA